MHIFEYTNKGGREVNQDYLLHQSLSEDRHTFVLADGMGGYSSGDVAAKLVCHSISDYMAIHIDEFPPNEVLRDAVVFANDELAFKRYLEGGIKMGTVIVVVLLVGATAYLTWLGDSRIYVVRNKDITFQSSDHSIINELRKVNQLRPDDYERYASIVTRAVMGDDKLGNISVTTFQIECGDTIILCSDGLHKFISPLSLPSDENQLRNYLDSNCQLFDDNYSLIKITI